MKPRHKHAGMEGYWSRERGEDHWCHVGGCRNWAKIGIDSQNDQYGLPHVAGWLYWEDGTETWTPYCIYCGAKVLEDREPNESD